MKSRKKKPAPAADYPRVARLVDSDSEDRYCGVTLGFGSAFEMPVSTLRGIEARRYELVDVVPCMLATYRRVKK